MPDHSLPLLIIGLSVALGTAMAVTGRMLLRSDESGFLGAVKAGLGASPWFLTQGRESDRFYDLDQVLTDPVATKSMVEWYVNMISEVQERLGGIDRLVFVENSAGPVGALVLSAALCERTRIPGIIVRPRRMVPVASVKGASPETHEEVVVLISDVATTGTSLIEAIDALAILDIHPKEAIVYLKRDGTAVEVLDSRKIKLNYGRELTDGAALDKLKIEKAS